jgi:osmotically-inducible protein OsmY
VIVALLSYVVLRLLRYSNSSVSRILGLKWNMEIWAMKNDTQIQQEVVAELDRDENVPSGAIGVEVHHGVVKLAGRINDAATEKSAELDARRVDGVTNIILDMGSRSANSPMP